MGTVAILSSGNATRDGVVARDAAAAANPCAIEFSSVTPVRRPVTSADIGRVADFQPPQFFKRLLTHCASQANRELVADQFAAAAGEAGGSPSERLYKQGVAFEIIEQEDVLRFIDQNSSYNAPTPVGMRQISLSR